MADILDFPKPSKQIAISDEGIKPDNDDGDCGPPVGCRAWQCNCGSFAFYATEASWHCYECHAVQVFD